MTDSPAAGATDFTAAAATFRDTAKWIVGGVAATAASILAGTPLTRLGELEPGSRLYLAIAAAAVVLIALGALVVFAVGVITATPISIDGLVTAKGWFERWRAARIQRQVGDVLPEAKTFAELGRRLHELYLAAPDSPEARTQLAELQSRADTRMPEVSFEFKRQRFLELCGALFLCGPIAAVSVGLYAWAATPPPTPQPLDREPRGVTLRVDPQTMSQLSSRVDAGCFARGADGAFTIRALVVSEYAGWSELVVTPGPGCRPARLREQNARLFVPRQGDG